MKKHEPDFGRLKDEDHPQKNIKTDTTFHVLQPFTSTEMDHSESNHVSGSDGSDTQRPNHESNSAKAKAELAGELSVECTQAETGILPFGLREVI